LESVISRANQLKNELAQSESVEVRISELNSELEKASEVLSSVASTLSQSRKQAAEPLTAAVKRLLSQVGIPNPDFQIRWDNQTAEKSELPGIRGSDRVEFFLSTNPGEPARPLVQIASGGEISRVMLALKAVLADSGGTYIMVFDEIDNGISGRIARKVGMVLRQLAKHRQIIVVTHLPQIASLGQFHLKVSKRQRGGRTFTEITPLEPHQRVEEIASLMAGAQVTERVRASAQELLANPN
jgi:DNA repair protein RecN (Recombination protein N)